MDRGSSDSIFERVSHLSTKVGKVIVGLEIGAQREDVASLAAVLAGAFHESENVQEILGNVVILLEEQNHAGVIVGDGESIEHAVRLPPPVVLGLRELGLPVVPVEIRVLGIRASEIQSPGEKVRR